MHPIFDPAQLMAFTEGDRELMVEVLRLFISQEQDYLTPLKSGDERQWREATHRLKGAARSIGAVRLAHLASLAEHRPTAEFRLDIEAEFDRLRATLIAEIGATRC